MRGFAVARGGVEPPTFRFSVGRSYQLSYLAAPSEDSRGILPDRDAGPETAHPPPLLLR